MSNLLIIEPHASGHHAIYVYWIVKEASRRGYNTTLATLNSSLEHPVFQSIRTELNLLVRILALPDHLDSRSNETNLLGLIIREFYYRRLFYKFYQESCQINNPDVVLVPYLDYCAHSIAILGSPFKKTKWSGIIMRPAFHLHPMGIPGPRSYMQRIKEKVFLSLLQNRELGMLFTIDEALHQFVNERRPKLARQFRYIPEPAAPKQNISKIVARKALGIPIRSFVILIYGVITRRKGLNELLQAANESEFPKNAHILLAGKQDKSAQEILKGSSAQNLVRKNRLHQINTFLSDDQGCMAFAASDIVWLGYRGHYNMSGVLVFAGRMGLPVLACVEGVIGRLTQKYVLGISVPISDKNRIINAIKKLAQDVHSTKSFGENGRRIFESHTPKNFSTAIFDSLLKADP